MRELQTPQGTARVLTQDALDPRAVLILGHGAGGSVSSPDLQVAARVALEEDVSVALVEQPYRVAGRGEPPPAAELGEGGGGGGGGAPRLRRSWTRCGWR